MGNFQTVALKNMGLGSQASPSNFWFFDAPWTSIAHIIIRKILKNISFILLKMTFADYGPPRVFQKNRCCHLLFRQVTAYFLFAWAHFLQYAGWPIIGRSALGHLKPSFWPCSRPFFSHFFVPEFSTKYLGVINHILFCILAISSCRNVTRKIGVIK